MLVEARHLLLSLLRLVLGADGPANGHLVDPALQVPPRRVELRRLDVHQQCGTYLRLRRRVELRRAVIAALALLVGLLRRRLFLLLRHRLLVVVVGRVSFNYKLGRRDVLVVDLLWTHRL